jgi:hypothetical protein
MLQMLNRLRVLGTPERSQVAQRICQPFPTAMPLLTVCGFSALTMREICLVIAPLDPSHEGEALLNRIHMQGQHDFK